MLLNANRIAKSFAGVRALNGVSFDLLPGEVHALVGENGAGKSTLIKVMTGAVTPDAGSLTVSGQSVPHMDPHTSRALGIAAIYQQPSLFPDLTVAENIALGRERGSVWRRLDWKERFRAAGELLERMGASIRPDRLVGSLSMPEQQMVEIAKAIGADARVIIMDEPTASLTEREADHLFSVVRLLRSHGTGVIYISHRLDEIFAIADRITVLRDGEAIATRASAGLERAELIRLMVGRELSSVFPKRPVDAGPIALEVRKLGHRASGIRDVSFTIRRGEILGIAGLVGSGRTELAETIFGLRPADEGEILIDGLAVTISRPARAIELGIGYVPEDRRHHGVVLEMSVAANASLANLSAIAPHGLIDTSMERRDAASYVQRLRIKASSVSTDVGTLSGGNQQKVALARWLAIKPRILILDEPTQGVDVGSKAEIHELMVSLAEQGLAVIMISSEMPEILGMSDRVAVMQGGSIRAILPRAAATQDAILSLALGDATQGGSLN